MKLRLLNLFFTLSLLFAVSSCNKNNEQSDFPTPDYTYCRYHGTISKSEYFYQGFSLGTGNYIFMAVTAKTSANYHFYFLFYDYDSVDYNDIFVNSYNDFTFINGVEETRFANYEIINPRENLNMHAIVFDKHLQENETFYFSAAYADHRVSPPPLTYMYVEITSGDFPFDPYLTPIK